MGEAKRRGSFVTRKAEAIVAGRIPEERRKQQREARASRTRFKAEYLSLMKALLKEKEIFKDS